MSDILAHVQKVLAENKGNKSATAKVLGIDRRTLYRWLAKTPTQSAKAKALLYVPPTDNILELGA